MTFLQKKLIVIGDPIEDIYAKVEDGKTISCDTLNGGASNTYMNAKAILFETNTFSDVHFVPELKFTDKYLYKVLRLNNQPDIHLSASSDKKNYYSDMHYLVQRQLNLLIDQSAYDSIIVFSDYNKGTLNLPIHKYKGIHKVKLGVVDSKYRSLHSTLFNFADNYIWRCTGQEYCPTFAKKFNYTIWTNGSEVIKLLDQNQAILETFQVPQIETIDTCGAGDTFTAALASFLFFNDSIELKNIKLAIRFAIKASLNVIGKPKTSITDIKI